jgi:hypothetical protein
VFGFANALGLSSQKKAQNRGRRNILFRLILLLLFTRDSHLKSSEDTTIAIKR